MKRFLSIFFSILFVIFGICTPNSSYATLSNNSVVTSSTKDLSVSETTTDRTKNLNKTPNILGNTLAVIFRTCGWGILGALTTVIPLVNISVMTGMAIGAICGATSKILEIYVQKNEK